jgi:hypothetical protein
MTRIGKQEFPKMANSVALHREVAEKLVPTNPDQSSRPEW